MIPQAKEANALAAIRENNPDLEGTLDLTEEVENQSDFPPPEISKSSTRFGEHLTIEGEFAASKRIQRISMRKGFRRIDFETELRDFTGGNRFIKIRFPLNIDWTRASIVYETPFAATTQRDNEHHCAQKWVDVGDGEFGAALINLGTQGFWVRDGYLDLVVLRSVRDYKFYHAPDADENKLESLSEKFLSSPLKSKRY